MKKLLLIAIACIGSVILAGCYKDDLKEFQEIDRIKLEESIAVPLINQKLDTSFYLGPVTPPLGYTFRFVLQDTVSITLPEQDTTEFIIDNVTFKGITENRYEGGSGTFKILFLDSLGNKKDSLPTPPEVWQIDAAPQNGVANDEFSLNVDRARYDQIRQWKKTVLQLTLDGTTAIGPNGYPLNYTDLDFRYWIGLKINGRTQIKF